MNAHVGLNVTNLEKSISFYTKLFNEEPVKIRENYAKFLPKELKLNFTLNVIKEVTGNQVGHFGIQVDTFEQLQKQKERMKQLGFSIYEEENTSCCYALQDKFWIADPDGNEWEYFFTKQDVEMESAAESTNACCVSNT